MNLKILLLPGDGIGVEVTREAARVLTHVAKKYGHTLQVAQGIIGGVADTVTGVGEAIKDANVPVVSVQTKDRLAGVVTSIGGAVGALGTGVQSGLGSMPNATNPVGTTVASTGGVVSQLGNAVTSAGSAVTGLGSGPLAPLGDAPGEYVKVKS